MPSDPQTGARQDQATIVDKNDATQLKPTDEGTLPATPATEDMSSEKTLPPPPRGDMASDVTLAPPKGTSGLASAGAPTGDFNSAMTLPPSSRPAGAEAPKASQRTIAMPVIAPHDATLDPNDPQAKAFQEAVTKSSAGSMGADFGDYQLLEPIAKGGMGIVYKARQRKLHRVVAIKMILAGQFADQTDVDRFYAEAAAAGKLSHPNIVGIHEIGEVNGQHFFSMDFIDGDSLSGLVRESPLTPVRAAEFVQTIAETMQFAHEHDIVHRDLKPSNVLVDKKGRPLITDFGLAKQVSNNQSQLTMEGAIVGTPSYMPPEQAAGDGDKIGPWSDIYSTGAILYELVTGRPPFRAASPFETVRQVLEMEPVSPRVVNPGVPKDLETICLKCLQKEPAKRYATSQELADELGRFLRNEPIKARPIGRAARLWRLCRRNPVPATAIAASVLFLVIAAIGASIGLVQTRQALVAKNKSFLEQMHAVNDLFTSVSEDTLLNQPGMQPLRKDLLQKALAYYQRFAQQEAHDPAVQDELASAYFRIGQITELLEAPHKALPHYESARQMQERLLRQRPDDPARLEALGTTLNAIGNLHVVRKDYADAQDAYAKALDTREQLAASDANDSEFQRLLANARMNIGWALYHAGYFERAQEELAVAQDIRVKALRRDPDNFKLLRDRGKGDFTIGNVAWVANQPEATTKHLEQAVAQFQTLIDENPNDLEINKLHALSLRVLGDFYASKSDPKAGTYYDAAVERLSKLMSKNPDILDYQLELAGVWMNVGQMEIDQNRSATVQFEQARHILAPLAERYPGMARYQRDLAKTLQALAKEQQKSTDVTEARQHFEQASAILGRLFEEHQADTDLQEQYASVLIDLGQFELEQGEDQAAATALRPACEVRETLAAGAKDDPWRQFDHAVALRLLGDAQQRAKDLEDSIRNLERAKAIMTKLKGALPNEPDIDYELELLRAALKPARAF